MVVLVNQTAYRPEESKVEINISYFKRVAYTGTVTLSDEELESALRDAVDVNDAEVTGNELRLKVSVDIHDMVIDKAQDGDIDNEDINDDSDEAEDIEILD
tara:strand:+ start:91 stop:393 length:303 start_codon:yes stop_codon:yes gene_type:complete